MVPGVSSPSFVSRATNLSFFLALKHLVLQTNNYKIFKTVVTSSIPKYMHS